MKKHIYLTAALAIVGAVSCNKEIADNSTPDAPEVKLATLTATIGEPGTKTTLDNPSAEVGSKTKTFWCEDDKLSVFDGVKNVEYAIKDKDTYEAAEEAVFEGAELADAEAYYALYPYTETATLDDGTIKGAVLPADQTAVAGNIPEGAALAVAYTEDRSEVNFKNVATTIGFTLTEAAEKVEFIAKGNENIAGTIDITFDGEGLPAYEVQDGTGSNTVTLTDLAVGTYYFTILPDVTLSQGYELKIDGYTARTGAIGKKLERSMIYSLESPKLTLSDWGIKGSHNDWGDKGATPMYEINNMAVALGVELTGGFKFFKESNTWIGGFGKADINTALKQGGSNIVVEDGTYDIFYDYENSMFYVMSVGSLPNSATTIPSKTYSIYVNDKTGWDKLYCHMYCGDDNITGNWPGREMSQTKEINSVNYKYFTVDVPLVEGSEVKIMFTNNSGAETPENGRAAFTVSEEGMDLYYKVYSDNIQITDPNSTTRDINVYCNNTNNWQNTIISYDADNYNSDSYIYINGVKYNKYEITVPSSSVEIDIVVTGDNSNQISGTIEVADDIYIDVNSQIKAATLSKVRLYIMDYNNWSPSYLHYWGTNDTNWPGVALDKTINFNGESLKYYEFDFGTTYQFIVNGGNGSNKQTKDSSSMKMDRDRRVEVWTDNETNSRTIVEVEVK